MKITQISSLLVITSLIAFCSFGQDTLFVKLNKRHIPRAATKSIHLKNFEMRSDTICETNKGKMNHEKRLKLKQIQRTHYFIFLDNKNRRIVDCYWDAERIYGHLKYYYRNNQIKREGGNYSGYACGEWKFYTRKGRLRKQKEYAVCSFD